MRVGVGGRGGEGGGGTEESRKGESKGRMKRRTNTTKDC